MKPYLYYRIIEKIHKFGTKWDKLSPSEENAIEFAYANINPEPERMIETSKFSLEYCLAYSGVSINKRFNTGSVIRSNYD